MGISFILPTRNAKHYLDSAFRCLSACPLSASEMEVVVADNGDAPLDLPDFVRDDARFRVFRPDRVLAMADNWEFAYRHSKGEWISYLGSDDAVLPLAMAKAAPLISSSAADAVLTRPATFLWPDLRHSSQPPQGGRSKLSAWIGGSYEWQRISRKDLRRRLRLSRWDNNAIKRWLPMPYNSAFVSKRAVERVMARQGGTLFRGSAPDIYLALAIGEVADEAASLIGPPCLMNGGSPVSNGASMASDNPDAPWRDFKKLNHWEFIEELASFEALQTAQPYAANTAALASDLGANPWRPRPRQAAFRTAIDPDTPSEAVPGILSEYFGTPAWLVPSPTTRRWLHTALRSKGSLAHYWANVSELQSSQAAMILLGSDLKVRTALEAATLLDQLIAEFDARSCSPEPVIESLNRFSGPGSVYLEEMWWPGCRYPFVRHYLAGKAG